MKHSWWVDVRCHATGRVELSTSESGALHTHIKQVKAEKHPEFNGDGEVMQPKMFTLKGLAVVFFKVCGVGISPMDV